MKRITGFLYKLILITYLKNEAYAYMGVIIVYAAI